MRLVLDTNVVLDMLLFDDPVVRPLARALAAGELTAWVDRETLGEFDWVLAFPTFKLDAAARQAAMDRYRALAHITPEASAPLPSTGEPVPPRDRHARGPEPRRCSRKRLVERDAGL